MQPNTSTPQEKLSFFKLVILVLSIVILAVLIVDTTTAVPGLLAIKTVLDCLDQVSHIPNQRPTLSPGERD